MPPTIVLKTPSMKQPAKNLGRQQNQKRVLVKVQAPKPPMQKKKRKRKGQRNPYLSSLINPFSAPVAHIPDQYTSASGLTNSFKSIRNAYPMWSGGSSYQHCFGFVMIPYPGCAQVNLQQLDTSASTVSDTGASGTTGSYYAVPNASALYGGGLDGCKVRCVSMGCRVIYEGTENNRAGTIFSGLAANVTMPNARNSTGTQLSVTSCFTGMTQPTLGDIRNSLTQVTEARVGEGVFQAVWKPSGVPTYQEYGGSTLGTTASAGEHVTNSLFQCSEGSGGCQFGQNFLVVMVEGDTTPSASAYSNTYNVEMVWNWEVVPNDPTTVAYIVSTSRMDMRSLENAINGIQTTRVAKYGKSGSSSSRF